MEEIINEIIALTKKKMREQGGYDRDAYKQFVEETIEYYLEKGKLDDDENLELLETEILERWDNIKETLANENI
ncbi:MAG: hypothetical protein PHT51_00250 [Patescibacteria group bacterium]|nr:hypothetical protein [Patescibacteria group bacterium]MDD4610664.1 hypothetical protein [Patescibacteria group bacterium]